MKKIFDKKIFIILCVIIFVLVIGFIFRNQIKNGIYNIKVSGISKDITIIPYRSNSSNLNSILREKETGYASTETEYYIDFNKQTIYKVEDYNVYQLDDKNYGHHYSLKSSKKLNDIEIEEFKNIESLESDVTSDTTYYYIIKYKDKTLKSTLSNSTIKNIINSLNEE